jgi:cytidylate kinase
MIITIDGPAAGGKSTDAKLLAQKLHFYYLSSGMLYRALAYLLVSRAHYALHTISTPQETDVASYTDPERLRYSYDPEHGAVVHFDDQDITRHLKEPEMDKLTSLMAVDKTVRRAINVLQKKIAYEHDVVVEGRDMGSAVFPEADVKFFITASPEVRAHRWQRMQMQRGNPVAIDYAMEAVSMRDLRDEKRSIAPLVIPEDAYIIDTSDLSPEQAVNEMLTIMSRYKK